MLELESCFFESRRVWVSPSVSWSKDKRDTEWSEDWESATHKVFINGTSSVEASPNHTLHTQVCGGNGQITPEFRLSFLFVLTFVVKKCCIQWVDRQLGPNVSPHNNPLAKTLHAEFSKTNRKSVKAVVANLASGFLYGQNVFHKPSYDTEPFRLLLGVEIMWYSNTWEWLFNASQWWHSDTQDQLNVKPLCCVLKGWRKLDDNSKKEGQRKRGNNK